MCVLRQRDSIEVPEGTRDGGLGLAGLRADGIGIAACLIVLVAGRAVRQCLGAPVGLARRLQIEESVHQIRKQIVGRGRLAEACAAHVAPAGTAGALVRDAVARRVDDVVRVPVWDRPLDLLSEALNVVIFIVPTRELWKESARVFATNATGGTAVVVHRVVECRRRARYAQRLEVAHIRRKATHLCRNLESAEEGCIRLRVRLPAEPAAVRGVNVDRSLGGGGRERVDRHRDALCVRCLGGRGGALWVALVRREVGDRRGLENEGHRHLVGVLGDDGGDRIDKVVLVLAQPRAAVALREVVARAVRFRSTAELAERVVGVAVSVGQIVYDEDHQRWRRLAGRPFQDGLRRVDDIHTCDPVRRACLTHLAQIRERGGVRHAYRRIVHVLLEVWVNVESVCRKEVGASRLRRHQGRGEEEEASPHQHPVLYR